MLRAYLEGDILCFEDIHDLILYMEDKDILNIDCSIGDMYFSISF